MTTKGIIVVVAVLLVAAGGASAYYLMNMSEPTMDQNPDTQPEQEAVEPQQANGISAETRAQLLADMTASQNILRSGDASKIRTTLVTYVDGDQDFVKILEGMSDEELIASAAGLADTHELIVSAAQRPGAVWTANASGTISITFEAPVQGVMKAEFKNINGAWGVLPVK